MSDDSRRALKTSISVMSPYEVLLCPQCEFEYVHITSVKVATGKEVTVITGKGTRVYSGETAEQHDAKGERGNRITLEYQCENGHFGEVVLQFHEGNVFVEHEKLTGPEHEGDIWRD